MPKPNLPPAATVEAAVTAGNDTDPLALAADAGRMVLEAGGETYRAESTFVRLCRSWSVRDAECFATPTGLIASGAGQDNQSRAVVRRIIKRSVDLRRIARIAEETTKVERLGTEPEAFSRILSALREERPYPLPAILIAAGASATFFTLLFGGSVRDAVAAFFVGVGIKAVSSAASSNRFPDFIVNILGGATAAALSSAAIMFGLADNLDKTVIGSIMQLVPGLATVNAIRDTIAGDLVAGVARLTEAIMAAAAISMGAGFALSISALAARFLV